MEDAAPAINASNVNQATGLIDGSEQSAAVTVNDRLNTPEDYRPDHRQTSNGSIVRVSSVATRRAGCAGPRARAVRWMAGRRC